MTINDEIKTDYWDQVETSQSFNTGITGNKLVSVSHVEAKKPGETDWFRVYGSKKEDLDKGLIVKVKVDVLDQDFLVIGPDDFKSEILDGFKKGRLVYLAYYVTSSNRLGVWPVTIPEADRNGNINSYNATAFQVMERAQHEWVNMKLIKETESMTVGQQGKKIKICLENRTLFWIKRKQIKKLLMTE